MYFNIVHENRARYCYTISSYVNELPRRYKKNEKYNTFSKQAQKNFEVMKDVNYQTINTLDRKTPEKEGQCCIGVSRYSTRRIYPEGVIRLAAHHERPMEARSKRSEKHHTLERKEPQDARRLRAYGCEKSAAN